MAINKSSGLVNVLAEAFATVGGGTLTVYTGIPPLMADNAPTGTMLYSVDTPQLVASSAGELEKPAGVIWSSIAVADGKAGWFRLSSGDPSIESQNMSRIDGTIGKKGSDIVLKSTRVDRGCIQSISQFRLVLS